MVLPTCVPLEDRTGLLEQFRRHGQVDLRVRQSDVPKVNGEVVHQSLHISPLAVPCRQTVHRKGVPLMPSSA